MLRGYRYVILAAFGWLALTGQHPNPTADPKQTRAQESIANSLSNIAATNNELAERAKRPMERQPCGPRNYQSDDDLCAQWKAADAASDAAWWTVFGSAISAASLLGVFIALAFARQSNAIARDTAKHQLRAYMCVEHCSIEVLPENKGFVLQAYLQNCGQTPAKNARIMAESFSSQFPLEEEKEFLPVIQGFGSTIGPGQKLVTAKRLFGDVENTLIKIQNGDFGLYIQGVCEYEDVFDRPFQTTFRFAFGGRTAELGPGLILHTAETGNSAT